MKNCLGIIVYIGVVFYEIIGCVGEKFYIYNSSTITLDKCGRKLNYYRCLDGTCIYKTRYCDGMINCPGTAEDERDCTRCPPGLCLDTAGSCSNKSDLLNGTPGFDYFNAYCKSSSNWQTLHFFDCTDVGLAYLPCAFDVPERLILDRNKLGAFNSLSDSTFLEYSRLEVLQLAKNEITYLPSNIFQSLRNLTNLKLSHNQIQRLNENIFENLHNLQYLYLNNNKIAYLSPEIFRNLRNLKELLLSRNRIEHLNETILRNQLQLQRLYLIDNKITILPPKIFGKLEDLRGLYLEGNAIRYLDEKIFKNLFHLEWLSLGGNRIETLNEYIFEDLHNLETLYLNSNDITDLPINIFQNLQNLIILSLENNRIQYLEETVFQNLTSLWILNLGNNKLSCLSGNVFRNLKNLGDLHLADNEISYIHEGVFQSLSQLESLNLGNNRLSNLPPKVFQNLRNLQILWLMKNQLQQLNEDVFENLHGLNSLYLHESNIANLTSNVFRNLKNLLVIRLEKNQIQYIDELVFENSRNLRRLYLQENNIVHLPPNVFRNLRNLTTLRLAQNQIQHLDVLVFENLHSLQKLDLSGNNIAYLPSNVFRNLKKLEYLHLGENRIKYLDEVVFGNQMTLQFLKKYFKPANYEIKYRNVIALKDLVFKVPLVPFEIHSNLSNNEITELPPHILKNSRLLHDLNLENNSIEVVDEFSFSGLFKLSVLNLKNNQIGDVDVNIFKDLSRLELLKTDEFRFCCMKKGIEECEAPSNEFSSCDDLLKDVLLRIFIWILGIIAVIANIFVIYVRIKYQNAKTNKVNLFLIVNLAISDLVMGVYLLMIAITDASYRGEYYVHDLQWRQSYWCDLAGVLSTFSSELTVLILTVISVDRLIAITFPFYTMQRGFSGTKLLVGSVWGFSAIISLVPHQIFGISYFKNFYGRSSVCLALHITNETPDGWEYSVLVFIFLNAISFIVIAVSYLLMYYQASRRKRGTITSSNQSSDTVMAVRMTLLVLADAACWIPIIVLGIRSLIGYALPPDVYPWIAVFVLPLNAALNPILYTISSIPLVIGAKYGKSTPDGQPYFKCFWRGLQLNAIQK